MDIGEWDGDHDGDDTIGSLTISTVRMLHIRNRDTFRTCDTSRTVNIYLYICQICIQPFEENSGMSTSGARSMPLASWFPCCSSATYSSPPPGRFVSTTYRCAIHRRNVAGSPQGAPELRRFASVRACYCCCAIVRVDDHSLRFVDELPGITVRQCLPLPPPLVLLCAYHYTN